MRAGKSAIALGTAAAITAVVAGFSRNDTASTSGTGDSSDQIRIEGLSSLDDAPRPVHEERPPSSPADGERAIPARPRGTPDGLGRGS